MVLHASAFSALLLDLLIDLTAVKNGAICGLRRASDATRVARRSMRLRVERDHARVENRPAAADSTAQSHRDARAGVSCRAVSRNAERDLCTGFGAWGEGGTKNRPPARRKVDVGSRWRRARREAGTIERPERFAIRRFNDAAHAPHKRPTKRPSARPTAGASPCSSTIERQVGSLSLADLFDRVQDRQWSRPPKKPPISSSECRVI
jgi:hypothetical protein